MCGPQNDNGGNWVVSHDIFTDVCGIYFLSWKWYSLSIHFFTVPFYVLTMVHKSMCTCWDWKIVLELSWKTNDCVHSWGMNYYMQVISGFTRKFHSFHQHLKKPFVSRIQTINELSAIYWCSNTTINYNIICMCQNW